MSVHLWFIISLVYLTRVANRYITGHDITSPIVFWQTLPVEAPYLLGRTPNPTCEEGKFGVCQKRGGVLTEQLINVPPIYPAEA